MIATMVQAAAQTAAPTNKLTFDGLKAEATVLGGAAGAGKDGYVKLLIRIAEAAYHGGIDLTPHKHGTGRDDTFEVIAAYAKAKGIASSFKGKADNERKLLSNGRKMGKVGQLTTLGPNQPLTTIGDLMLKRNKRFLADPKTTDDAANSLLRWATAQLRSTSLIEGDSLEAFCRKTVKDDKTAKAILKQAKKMIEKLGDTSQEIRDATTSITRRINAITLAEVAENQKQAKAA
jgi:hypothetical protein